MARDVIDNDYITNCDNLVYSLSFLVFFGRNKTSLIPLDLLSLLKKNVSKL
jgi:hypothetical protein